MRERLPVVVLGVIGNDIHVVANRVLQICLEAAGFQVMNIATNARPDIFIDAALEVDADAILVGSLNGEAPHWCKGLRAGLNAVGKGDIWIYLGGNVVVGQWEPERVQSYFRDMGIDRVYYGSTDFDVMIERLAQDIRDGRPV